MPDHRPIHLAIIVTTVIVAVLMFVVNLSYRESNILGLYKQRSLEAAIEKYYVYTTPDPEIFSNAGIGTIFIWQSFFLAYGLSTIFRQGPDGYLYYSPGIMPVGIYISYSAHCVCHICWLILFDREIIAPTLAVMLLMWLTLFIPLLLSHKAVYNNIDVLTQNKLLNEAWLIRYLVQNAHGFYIAMVTVASTLNLNIVLVFEIGMDQSTASTISICFLAIDMIILAGLDLCVLYKYTNYLFSPYIVIPMGLLANLYRQFKPWTSNTVFALVLLMLSLIALLVKLVLLVVRTNIRCSIHPVNKIAVQPKQEEGNSHSSDNSLDNLGDCTSASSWENLDPQIPRKGRLNQIQ